MILDLIPDDEQQLIEDSLRGFLRDRLPVARLREASAHGGAAEQAVWEGLAGLGLFGLGVSEDKGGLGYGFAEEALVARALGVHLVSPSVLAQVLAPHYAEDDGLREALISGELRAAFADGIGHAIDAGFAEQLLVLSGGAAALVETSSAGLGEPVVALDETVELRAVGNQPKAGHDAARIGLMLAAYLTGIAQTARDMAVAYAKEREQFNQPIGAFQAIKHICADMAVRVAAADAQVFYAAVSGDAAPSPAGEVAAARLLAVDAAIENAKANIQIHGGMGFTAECDAHLLLKRAHLIAALGADKAGWRAQVLDARIL
jgi:alkylation response protein AidB-like acyl-CoA dehydrogenase